MSIPRYSINPLWWNIPLMDDHNGKLCEYRDYAKLNADNARLKAEVERLEAFTTRTIIPNEELQAQVETLQARCDFLEGRGL